MPSVPVSTVTMREFFAAGARALVDAQLALDAHADATDDAMPEAAFAYTSCRLRFPAGAECRGRTTVSDHAVVSLSPANSSTAAVTMIIRRVPRPVAVEVPDAPH